MSKQIKELAAKEYRERYQGIKNCLFADYRGLNAIQSVQLRNWLKSEAIRMNVLKNSVARLVFKDIGFPEADQFISGPVAFIYSEPGGKGDDPIVLSKQVFTWQIKHKVLKVQGGYVEGKTISAIEAKELSRLPSRKDLFAYCAQLLNRPMTQLAWCLNAVIQRLAIAVNALAAKTPEPAQKTDQPKDKTPEPDKKPEQPQAKAPEPDKKPDQPQAKAPEPDKKPDQPKDKTPEPDKKPEQAQAKAPEPVQKTDQPKDKTPEPDKKPDQPENKS